MTEKTIGIIVARMASSRLSGKALRLIEGKPLLNYVLERLKLVTGLDEIWLATTQHPSDEQLVLWGIENNVQVLPYAGETDDLVGRVSAVLDKSQADRFILALGDTPFIDPRLLNNLLAELDKDPELEAVHVDHSEKTSVHGGSLCYRTSGWKKVDEASTKPYQREHLGSVLKEQPELISRIFIEEEPLYYEGPYRLSIDTLADYALVENLIKILAQPGEILSLEKILLYLREHPELTEYNAHVRQRLAEEAPPKVLLAVQAGGHFGGGHLARCKTLARNLQEYFAAGVSFWMDTPQPAMRKELAADGYTVVEGAWSLAETVRQGGYDRVIVDFKDPVAPSLVEGMRLAAPQTSVIALDNNGMGCMSADAVVFPNVHSEPDPRWAKQQEHIYCGSDYVVLGSNFIYNPINETLTKQLGYPTLLITMGSADPGRLSEKVLEALKDLKDCHIDMVIPPQYPFPEGMEKIATRMPSTVTLHWRLDSIRPLMQRATMAICAFGVTAYELASMGVPAVMIGHNEAQVKDLDRFCSYGSAVNLGDGTAITTETICKAVCDLIDNPEQRREMSEKGKKMVDNHGAYRVAELVMATSRMMQMINSDNK